MAKPVFIVCAESLSHDKGTNLVSLFHVLEGYTITPPPFDGSGERPAGLSPNAVLASTLNIVGVATWARDDGDGPDVEYDFIVELYVPWEDKPQTINEGRMTFTKPFQRFMNRMTLGIKSFPKHGGDIRFISKMRRVGADEWLKQEYRVPVTIATSPELNE